MIRGGLDARREASRARDHRSTREIGKTGSKATGCGAIAGVFRQRSRRGYLRRPALPSLPNGRCRKQLAVSIRRV